MSPRPQSRSEAPPAPDQPLRQEEPAGLEPIAPPGRLREEDRDSALTGGTRSLQRRVMGLDVLTPSKTARKTEKPVVKKASSVRREDSATA